MIQQILIYLTGFWLICFTIAVYLSRGAYEDLVEELEWVFHTRYIKAVYLLICFVQGPFLLFRYIVEWYTFWRIERLVEKLRKKYNITDEEIWFDQTKHSRDQSQKEENTK